MPVPQWWERASYAPASRANLTRTLLKDNRQLIVPVEGGGSALKRALHRGDISGLRLSNHGRWRDEHLGTLSALYGKAPYYPHIMDRIETVYRNSNDILLADFNLALIEIANNMLNLSETLPALREMQKHAPARFEALHNEISKKINPDYSIFDALFRLGKESIFGLSYEDNIGLEI